MLLAWGLLAPVGITLALFYKVVWPNGEWLYVSSRCMHLKVVATFLMPCATTIVESPGIHVGHSSDVYCGIDHSPDTRQQSWLVAEFFCKYDVSSVCVFVMMTQHILHFI